jgi:hypothetical protein
LIVLLLLLLLSHIHPPSFVFCFPTEWKNW